MKRHRAFKVISNILFALGGAIALYAIISIFFLRASLPAGVCPVDNSRPWLYVAIGLLSTSLIMSFLEGKNNEKIKDEPPSQHDH